MIEAPEIVNSTEEERRAYVKERFPCIADCDMCGLCTVFHGKDACHDLDQRAWLEPQRGILIVDDRFVAVKADHIREKYTSLYEAKKYKEVFL